MSGRMSRVHGSEGGGCGTPTARPCAASSSLRVSLTDHGLVAEVNKGLWAGQRERSEPGAESTDEDQSFHDDSLASPLGSQKVNECRSTRGHYLSGRRRRRIRRQQRAASVVRSVGVRRLRPLSSLLARASVSVSAAKVHSPPLPFSWTADRWWTPRSWL